MKDISQKDVNIRLIRSAKEFSYTNGYFTRDSIKSDTESYLRTLFYPSSDQSSELNSIEYGGSRISFYTREADRLNYFSDSFVDDLSNFFNTSLANITQSVADPYSGTNAIGFYNETASAGVYDTLSGDYYCSLWVKTLGSTVLNIENTTASVTSSWEYKTLPVTVSGNSIDFYSSDEIYIYNPRLYKSDHNLYAESLPANVSTEQRSYMYHMSSSYKQRPNGINTNSFSMNLNEKYVVSDDGDGNLVHNGDQVGNIFYDHGHVFIDDRYFLSGSTKKMEDYYLSSSFVDYSYTSDVEMLKTTITDLLESDYYNATGNQTYTGSVDLYVNKILLYNEENELIMAGNLSKPISTKHDIFFVLEMLEVL